MSRLSDTPLDAAALAARVRSDDRGAVLVFEGVARADATAGTVVSALEYEAWGEAAERALEAIEDEARRRWPALACAVAHRVGRVDIGTPAVVIAVAAPHRDDAYAASRWLIDTLKARVPIWKKEHRADGGAAWVANRP